MACLFCSTGKERRGEGDELGGTTGGGGEDLSRVSQLARERCWNEKTRRAARTHAGVSQHTTGISIFMQV